MSFFSTVLTKLMDQKGTVNNEVIRYTGINRSTFFKIKNGIRNPSGMDMLEKIARALRLNNEDWQSLVKAYEIDQIGYYRYYGMEAIRQFFMSDVRTSHSPSVQISIPEFQENEYVRVFRDVSEVIAAILGVLNQKSQQIKIMESRMNNIFKAGIPQAARNYPETEFIHIFKLNDMDTVEDDQRLYNVNCFRLSMDVVARTDRYHPRYIYSSVQGDGLSRQQVNFVLSDRYLLTYSDELESAVLYNDKEMLKLYEGIFEKGMEMSTAFIDSVKSLDRINKEPWMEILTNKDDEIYCFVPGIYSSLLVGDTEAMMKSYISDEYEGKKEMISYLCTYKDRLQKEIQRMGSSFHIISSCNALEQFASTGFLNEFPRSLSVPFSPEERIAVLRKWKHVVEQYNVKGIREKCIPDTSSLTVFSTSRKAFITFLNDQRLTDIQTSVRESSIAELIFLFLEKHESENTMEANEYKDFIDGLITEINTMNAR